MPSLKRSLNLTEVVFFASGVILGAGIYTVIGKAAGLAGNMLWLSFLFASLTALFTIFAYAELASLFPKAGGEFFYVKETLGKKIAYMIGSVVALGGIVAAATIALGFSGYFSELLEVPQAITGLGITGLILLVNISGIKHSSAFNIVFTIVEAGGLLFVIFSALPQLGSVNYLEPGEQGLAGILAGAALSFFAFTGFEDTVKLAEETKEPKTTVPKALFIASAIVILLYLVITVLAVSAVPYAELGESEHPLSTIAEKRFGKTGATVLAIIALFSTSNSLLSNMTGASRVVYQIGKETKWLSLFSKVSQKRKTPVPALLLCASVSAAFVLIGDISKVALIANFFVFITFLTVNFTLIYLRVTQPELRPAFRVPLNIKNIPVIPILGILSVLVLMGFAVRSIAEF